MALGMLRSAPNHQQQLKNHQTSSGMLRKRAETFGMESHSVRRGSLTYLKSSEALRVGGVGGGGGLGENMPPLTHPQPAVGPAKVRRSGATRCGEMREVSWDEVPLGCLPAWEAPIFEL